MFPERGKLSQAADAFIRSRGGWLAQENNPLAMEAPAGLAGTEWMQGDRTQPLSLVEQVLDFRARQPLEGVDERVQIYLTCYSVLKDCVDHQLVTCCNMRMTS